LLPPTRALYSSFHEKACQAVRRGGPPYAPQTRYRHASIRTRPQGIAFGPVHVRARRGSCNLTHDLFYCTLRLREWTQRSYRSLPDGMFSSGFWRC
jgi:hypothetical protein